MIFIFIQFVPYVFIHFLTVLPALLLERVFVSCSLFEMNSVSRRQAF